MKCAETLRDKFSLAVAFGRSCQGVTTQRLQPLAKPVDAHRERRTIDPAPDFQDAHHPAIKARQRVPLSPANSLHQVRQLMAPQMRASSIDLVVEPIALRGQMREVVILEVEDNGTGIPPRCTRSLRRWSAKLEPPCQWGLLRRESVCRPYYAEPPLDKIVHRAILLNQ